MRILLRLDYAIVFLVWILILFVDTKKLSRILTPLNLNFDFNFWVWFTYKMVMLIIFATMIFEFCWIPDLVFQSCWISSRVSKTAKTTSISELIRSKLELHILFLSFNANLQNFFEFSSWLLFFPFDFHYNLVMFLDIVKSFSTSPLVFFQFF